MIIKALTLWERKSIQSRQRLADDRAAMAHAAEREQWDKWDSLPGLPDVGSRGVWL